MSGLSFQVDSNALDVLASYRELPDRIKQSMAAALDTQNELTVGHIQKDKLTAAGPEYLNVRSGRLRGSVRRSNAVITADGLDSEIGSNVGYAGAHEFGFEGSVAVKGHTRRIGSSGRSGGRNAAPANPAGAAYVRAHTRHVKMRARHMFGSGIADRQPNYEQALSEAIVSAAGEAGQ